MRRGRGGARGGNRSATQPAVEVSAWPCCQNNKRSGLGEEELVLLASRPGGKGKKMECLCDRQTEPTESDKEAWGGRPWPQPREVEWGQAGNTGQPSFLPEPTGVKVFSTRSHSQEI